MNWLVESTKRFVQLNYIEEFLTLASTITRCISSSAFVSLISIPAGTASSEIGLKITTIIAGIKKAVLVNN